MEAADNVPDAGLFSQRKGEACFMRAFQYYKLAELFGGVPLILSTTQETNTPRATADDGVGADSYRFAASYQPYER